MDIIYSWDFGNLSWDFIIFFIYNMYLKFYLEGEFNKFVFMEWREKVLFG